MPQDDPRFPDRFSNAIDIAHLSRRGRSSLPADSRRPAVRPQCRKAWEGLCPSSHRLYVVIIEALGKFSASQPRQVANQPIPVYQHLPRPHARFGFRRVLPFVAGWARDIPMRSQSLPQPNRNATRNRSLSVQLGG